MVLEDAGRAVMRVAAALRAVAASADATAGRMEIISSGSGFEAGGCRQPVVIQGSRCRCGRQQLAGRRRAAVPTKQVGLVPAASIYEGMLLSAQGGERFARAAFGRLAGQA